MNYYAYRMAGEMYMLRKADIVIPEDHQESKEFDTPQERDAFIMNELEAIWRRSDHA